MTVSDWRLQFWRSWEYGDPLHCIYSPVYSDPIVILLVRVPFINQIELCKQLIIGKKKCNGTLKI